MKFLLTSYLFLTFIGLISSQESPQWQHFYGNHKPANISTSSNRVAMTGGKGIMRYNIDTEEIKHYNILNIPDLPTNDWSNVLENKAYDALWAVPTEHQVKELAPLYRHEKIANNWVAHDLDEMFNAEFDYQKLGTSPSGRVLVPGIRTENDGNLQLVIAIHQSGLTWNIRTVMDNPEYFKTPIGSSFNHYFIDTGSTGIYASYFSGNNIDLIEDLSENYTPNHHLIDARAGQFDKTAYFINDGIRIFQIDLSAIFNTITEYETEEFNLPGNFTIAPRNVILDRDRYFWAVGNNQLWRFRQGETTLTFPLNSYETENNGDWNLLLTDNDANVWLSKQNTSQLWRYSVATGMQKVDFGSSEMPLGSITPLGLIGNHGFVFNAWKQNTTFSEGDFLNIDLDLEGDEGLPVWRFPIDNKFVAYGRSRTDKYFVQEYNSDERQVFYPQTESGESLSLQGIVSVNSKGDLLGYVDAFSSTSIRQYVLKRKENDYWEMIDHPVNQDPFFSTKNFIFYDDDQLVGTPASSNFGESFIYWYDINASSNPITEAIIEDNSPALSIIKSAENIWMYNDQKIALMIDETPVFKSNTEIGLLEGEHFKTDTATPDRQGNIWLTTTLGRVLLWNGEQIINQFHTGNSGLQFKPTDIYLDALDNLWMCRFKKGCTVYNEAGVNFAYENINHEEGGFNIGENPFVLSPNPVRDFLTIRSAFEMNSIKIYDALGRELTSVKTDAVDNWEINTSNWADGVYFGTINAGLNQQTFKFIKQ